VASEQTVRNIPLFEVQSSKTRVSAVDELAIAFPLPSVRFRGEDKSARKSAVLVHVFEVKYQWQAKASLSDSQSSEPSACLRFH
jgi:hypothetical protein